MTKVNNNHSLRVHVDLCDLTQFSKEKGRARSTPGGNGVHPESSH